jgi:hypothetical protein
MVRRQTPGRREQAERPGAGGPDADEVGIPPAPVPEPVEVAGVVGLPVEEIGAMPELMPEPLGEPPALLGRPPDATLSALDLGAIAEPIPAPVGAVGMDPNPVYMTAGGFGEVADLPMVMSESLEGEGVALGDEEGPVPSSEPNQLLADDEEGPIQS